LALVVDDHRVGHQTLHASHQEMGEIDSMREHVAQFAGAGELFDLAPA
jgi:hypothetical protein